MYELVLALVRRLERLGGELRLATPVRGLVARGGRVRRVETDHGGVDADAVVLNGDPFGTAGDLLPRGRPAARERSVSGLALMLGLRPGAPGQAHHTIRFPRDYDAELDDVFVHRRPARDPTIYVCAPAASGDPGAPPGAERWFVLVNAPAVGDGADWDAAEAAVLDRLGVVPRIVARARRTPADIARETAAPGGAIYGAAPHGRLGTLRRPANAVPGVANAWLVGGAVHPGGGLPLVALGGELVARAVGRAA
jgi:phytoene dehydrogenase-like protein